jgi:ankyrin repeat protein
MLLARQAEVNAKDNDGSSNLHLAAANCSTDFAEMRLGEWGRGQCQGQPGLHAFALGGDESPGHMVQLLRQHGGQDWLLRKP